MALFRQLLGYCQAGRPRSHHSDLVARRWLHLRHGQSFCHALCIGDERLQLANGDRSLRLQVFWADREANDTVAFAKTLLRTKPSAHLRQVARLTELVGSANHIALFQQ